MKENFALIVLATLIISCQSEQKNNATVDNKTNTSTITATATVVHLNATQFKERVFDYSINKQWVFKGNKPCIVDFYADWCGPCKLLSPIVENMARKYAGKLDVYKVNIDEQQGVAMVFGVNSIPSVLFCPMSGQPQMSTGLLSEQDLDKAIQTIISK